MFVTPTERLLAAIRDEFGVKAATKLPRDYAGLFVRVDPSGPRPLSPVSEESLTAVQVYGDDLEEVLDLIYRLRFFLQDDVYTRDVNILWWGETTGPHEFPDPDTTGLHRWQLIGLLTTAMP